jgi:hypothetical protein
LYHQLHYQIAQLIVHECVAVWGAALPAIDAPAAVLALGAPLLPCALPAAPSYAVGPPSAV